VNHFLKSIFFFIALLLCICSVKAQEQHWYVLKSTTEIQKENIKSVLNTIQTLVAECEVWHNEGTSNTIGCKSNEPIEWESITPSLIELGIYLSDITQGENHHEGLKARTSFFYMNAYFFALYPDQKPNGYIAKLNEDEWESLPEEIQEIYESKNNYYIIND
jgi:hypothetical protein